jgi:anaerobic dimethyl sulfoxide reductase subunit A
MKDGIPVRQKTDDSLPFTDEYPQYRACIKGRAIKWSVFSPDRLKYPMKRKNWQPGGGAYSNGALRGKDEWVRISWDEALSLITQELKRILAGVTPTNTPEKMYGVLDFIDGYPKEYHAEYGRNLPILNMGYSSQPTFLNAAGYGSIPVWGHNSSGAWPAVVAKMAASPIGTANTVASDRLTVQNHSDLILLWGANPTWTKYGPTQIAYMNARKRGAKIICVDSWLSPGNSALVDEWIPCRPGTDAALLLAVAYLMIKHDEDPANAGEPSILSHLNIWI